MKKIFFVLGILTLGFSGFGQSAGAPGAKSTSNEAALTIYKRLAKEIAVRTGKSDDLTVIARLPLRIVFLQDVSRSSAQADYVDFTRNFCSRFLTELGKAQGKLGIAPEKRVLVSYYPYQHHIYQRSNVVKDVQLRPRAGVVDLIASTIPNQRISVRGESPLGHDSSGSRRQLIQLLGDTSNVVIIQITPSTLNEDPDNPRNERIIKRFDARTGQLDSTNIVPFGDIDTPFQTESKLLGNSQDVHIWLYGPERFNPNGLLARGQDSGTQEVVPNDVGPKRRGSGFPTVFAFLLLLLGIGVAIYRFLIKTSTIDFDGVRRQVTSSKPLTIVTETGKQGNVLVLPNQYKGTLQGGMVLAEISLTGFLGEPQIRATGGTTMLVNNSPKLSTLLTQRPINIIFEDASKNASVTIPIKTI